MAKTKQIPWWDWVEQPAETVQQLAADNNYTTTICHKLPEGLDIFAPSKDFNPKRLNLLVVDNIVKQVTLG